MEKRRFFFSFRVASWNVLVDCQSEKRRSGVPSGAAMTVAGGLIRRALRFLLLFCLLHIGLQAAVPAQASSKEVAGADSVSQYFRYLRRYLGDDVFEQHSCLVKQEQYGWVSRNRSTLPMTPFALGVEGSGHHALISLLRWGDSVDHRAHFPAVHGRIGADSVPSTWRSQPHVVRPGMHPDFPAAVRAGNLIFVLLRYPPTALLSSIRRFAHCQSPTREHHTVPVTMRDELDVLVESLVTVDALLRYPDMDCGRVVFVPTELLLHHPMVMLRPLAQALRIPSTGAPKLWQLLRRRLYEVGNHSLDHTDAEYRLNDACCDELSLNSPTNDVQRRSLNVGSFTIGEKSFDALSMAVFRRIDKNSDNFIDVSELAAAAAAEDPADRARLLAFFTELVGQASDKTKISRETFLLGCSVLQTSRNPADAAFRNLLGRAGMLWVDRGGDTENLGLNEGWPAIVKPSKIPPPPPPPALPRLFSKADLLAAMDGMSCHDRVFRYAREYLDSRRFMYPTLYPDQDCLDEFFTSNSSGDHTDLHLDFKG